MMSNRCGTPVLFDAKEIVALASHYASLNSVYAAKSVYDAWWATHVDAEANRIWVLASIFEAGRVQGIREERQRRRRQG